MTAAPLVSFSGVISSLVAPACRTFTGANQLFLQPASFSTALSATGYTWPGLTGFVSSDIVILIGFILSVILVSVFLAADAHPEVEMVVDPLLKSIDIFAKLTTGRAEGADLKPAPRRLGGILTLLGSVVFLTIALVIIFNREADNVNVQESIAPLTDARYAKSRALPIFSASWSAGVQVRITASGDGTACSRPIEWRADNADAGGWGLSTASPCGGVGTTQLIFTCPDCLSLDSVTTLSVTLHYSCQSLLIEAGAIDGVGVVTAFALPAAKTAAFNGTLVSSIAWSIPTLFSVVNSTVDRLTSSRGYSITSGSYSIGTNDLPDTPDGGLAVVPTTASVSIKISFPLNAFFLNTLLTQKQSLAVLVSSIIGLAGIFTFLNTLIVVTDGSGACSACVRQTVRYVKSKRSSAKVVNLEQHAGAADTILVQVQSSSSRHGVVGHSFLPQMSTLATSTRLPSLASFRAGSSRSSIEESHRLSHMMVPYHVGSSRSSLEESHHLTHMMAPSTMGPQSTSSSRRIGDHSFLPEISSLATSTRLPSFDSYRAESSRLSLEESRRLTHMMAPSTAEMPSSSSRLHAIKLHTTATFLQSVVRGFLSRQHMKRFRAIVRAALDQEHSRVAIALAAAAAAEALRAEADAERADVLVREALEQERVRVAAARATEAAAEALRLEQQAETEKVSALQAETENIAELARVAASPNVLANVADTPTVADSPKTVVQPCIDDSTPAWIRERVARAAEVRSIAIAAAESERKAARVAELAAARAREAEEEEQMMLEEEAKAKRFHEAAKQMRAEAAEKKRFRRY